MDVRFYSRPGLNVELYGQRLFSNRNGLVGEIPFYLALAEETPGAVLELGCGTGRIALPLARAGHSVTGIDLADAMLERAHAALAAEPEEVRDRLRLLHGDICDFDLGEQFSLIIIAFRTFQFLLTRDEEQRCLACVRRHLQPGGRVVIDIFDPYLEALAPGPVAGEPPLTTEQIGSHPTTGNPVRVEVLARTNDTINQTFEEVWRFVELDRQGAIVREERELLSMRWIYRYEMQYLLERAGLEVVAEYSDFDRSPRAYAKEQIWLATPAE